MEDTKKYGRQGLEGSENPRSGKQTAEENEYGNSSAGESTTRRASGSRNEWGNEDREGQEGQRGKFASETEDEESNSRSGRSSGSGKYQA